jgi:hypothetical protein
VNRGKLAHVLFWICVGMFAFNILGVIACAVSGVVVWEGVAMGAFWMFLAWVHARRIDAA